MRTIGLTAGDVSSLFERASGQRLSESQIRREVKSALRGKRKYGVYDRTHAAYPACGLPAPLADHDASGNRVWDSSDIERWLQRHPLVVKENWRLLLLSASAPNRHDVIHGAAGAGLSFAFIAKAVSQADGVLHSPRKLRKQYFREAEIRRQSRLANVPRGQIVASSPEHIDGIIRFYDPTTGTGQVTPLAAVPQGHLRMHVKDVREADLPELLAGKRVRFVVRPSPDGPRAEDLLVLKPVPPPAMDASLPALALTLVDQRFRVVSLHTDGMYSFVDSRQHAHRLLHVRSAWDDAWSEQIAELESLINNDRVKEQALQRFFEKHPHFLAGDDYQEAIPHVVLERVGLGPLIPDFALKPANENALCDLLELKLPQSRLIVGRPNRRGLSAAVREAGDQLRSYRDYFDLPEHREATEAHYKLRFFKPKMIVVIGRRREFSPYELAAAQADQPQLTLRTYDDLLARAAACSSA